MSAATLILRLSRPKNALPPVLALLIGYLAANGADFGDAGLVTAGVGLLLLNFFATLHNDLADKTIDQDTDRTTPYLRGQVTAQQIRIVATGLIALAIGLPLALDQRSVVLFLLVYSCLVWAYNAPPFQLSRRPLSSVTLLALLFSTLPLWLGQHLAGGTDTTVLIWLLLGASLQRLAVSILKDYKDFSADKKHHKRTFLVVFGPRLVSVTSLGFSTLGYLSMIIGLAIIAPATSTSMITLVLISLLASYGVWLRLQLRSTVGQFSSNNTLFHRLIDVQNIFDIGVILWLYCF